MDDQSLLNAIKEFNETKGYSPTVRELCAIFGVVSPSTVWVRLRRMREQGLVTWVPGAARTLSVNQ